MSAACRVARRREVRCPDCGSHRTVSLEQALKIQKGVSTGKCSGCRNPPKIVVREDHRRYWLIRAGVAESHIAAAGGSAAFVRSHGLPAALDPIAASAAFLPRQ